MKIPALVIFALLSIARPLSAQSPENRYDALANAILPMLQAFSPESTQHALRLDGSLSSMTNQPAELQNAAVSIVVQPPEQLLLRVVVNGETYALARDGQSVWAAPGAKVQALIAQIPKLPKPEPDFTLPPMWLPVPTKQLVLLPMLLQVVDAGNVEVTGQTYRVLDAALMPELAKNLKVEEWSARLWLRADDSIAQIRLSRPGWQITLALSRIQTAEKFADSTWQPAPDQADVLKLDAVKFKQLLDAAGREIRKAAKKAQP